MNFTLANTFHCVFEGYVGESGNEWERFKRQLEEEAASKKTEGKEKK